jgi:hypothetical protein
VIDCAADQWSGEMTTCNDAAVTLISTTVLGRPSRGAVSPMATPHALQRDSSRRGGLFGPGEDRPMSGTLAGVRNGDR